MVVFNENFNARIVPTVFHVFSLYLAVVSSCLPKAAITLAFAIPTLILKKEHLKHRDVVSPGSLFTKLAVELFTASSLENSNAV